MIVWWDPNVVWRWNFLARPATKNFSLKSHFSFHVSRFTYPTSRFAFRLFQFGKFITLAVAFFSIIMFKANEKVGQVRKKFLWWTPIYNYKLFATKIGDLQVLLLDSQRQHRLTFLGLLKKLSVDSDSYAVKTSLEKISRKKYTRKKYRVVSVKESRCYMVEKYRGKNIQASVANRISLASMPTVLEYVQLAKSYRISRETHRP